jgi:hypothetical protein
MGDPSGLQTGILYGRWATPGNFCDILREGGVSVCFHHCNSMSRRYGPYEDNEESKALFFHKPCGATIVMLIMHLRL